MGFNSEPCITIECDGCGSLYDHDYVPHFASRGDAEEHVRDHDGAVAGDRLWCDNCIPDCRCGHAYTLHYENESCDSSDCTCADFNPSEATHDD